MTTQPTPPLPYHLDPSPGTGALPARAHLASDRPEASLDGAWGFRFAASLADAHPDPASPGAAFPDTVAVPGHWVLDEANGPLVLGRTNRFGSPWYTNVQYPFPLDPPFVPDTNGTGDHLREFTADSLGFTSPVLSGLRRVLLRFEGVESTFRVWLNGTELGHASGSRLTHEFDATDALLPGAAVNRLVVRVHAFSAASYLEDQDQWWLPGIFRGVTLIGEPAGGVHDVRVVADYDGGTGHLTLEADAPAAAFPLRLDIPGLGIGRDVEAPTGPSGTTGATGAEPGGGPLLTARLDLSVGAVEGWTAETPTLHTAHLRSRGETVTLRLGFRRVDIADGVLRVNGSPIRLKGVNRHEFHPRHGRAVSAAFTRGELETMKRHNINAIRTSHYPPHHHLLELADELGFWLVDECDLETHGFVAAGWAGNPSDDPAWLPAYLDRIERTWRRDANHASVIMFSLGNESGTGANLAAMAGWLRGRDPMRPIHYEGDHDAAYTDVYSRMYATPTESAAVLAGEPVPSASVAGSSRIATQPYVLCEYVHAMGNGPGGIADYEALFDAHPRAAGGFVWEYKDHGILAATPDGREVFAYGGDFAEPIHDANFVLDGLGFADGTPSPGLLEYAKAIEPVRVAIGHDVRIENRQDFATTAAYAFHWRIDPAGGADAGSGGPRGTVQREGVLDVPATGPRTRVSVPLPEEATGHDGGILTLSVRLATETWWAPRGYEVAWGQGILGTPAEGDAATGAAGTAVVHAATTTAEPPATGPGPRGLARFETGNTLAALGDLQLAGPSFQAFRAPTDNDAGTIEPTRDLRPGGAGGAGIDAQAGPGFDWDAHAGTTPGPVVALAERWYDAGLHRLQRRTVSRSDTGGTLGAVHRYGTPSTPTGFDVDLAWSVQAGALRLHAHMAALQEFGFPLAQLGLGFTLPADALSDASPATFVGAGPGESYPDSGAAQRLGTHTLTVGQLRTDYPCPQANGRRGRIRALDLGLADGTTLSIRVASGPADTGFTLGPWSQQDLAAASHPTELPTSTAWHLVFDAGQHGLGSRSCGVDVPTRDAFTDTTADLVLDFTLLPATSRPEGTP